MASTPAFTITAVRNPTDISTINILFTAYAASLPIDLSFQSFASELANLPGAYSPPAGELFLARRTGDPALCSNMSTATPSDSLGCIALRPLPTYPHTCELKRLYVVPDARGLGVGKALVTAALDAARRLRYHEVRLDTLPEMRAARRLYEEVGFEARDAYYDTPIQGTAFLGMRLDEGA